MTQTLNIYKSFCKYPNATQYDTYCLCSLNRLNTRLLKCNKWRDNNTAFVWWPVLNIIRRVHELCTITRPLRTMGLPIRTMTRPIRTVTLPITYDAIYLYYNAVYSSCDPTYSYYYELTYSHSSSQAVSRWPGATSVVTSTELTPVIRNYRLSVDWNTKYSSASVKRCRFDDVLNLTIYTAPTIKRTHIEDTNRCLTHIPSCNCHCQFV